MEENGVNLQTGTMDEIQKRRGSNRSSRDSSSFQQRSSFSSNDDPDLQLFKWAQSNEVRRRSSDAARHKWITENMKDGNQSDDDDPLGLLNETNNDDDDYDDSPISSRADSKSPQVLFPPDSLWEEARRDSFFEKARRDSIKWVEENKQAILQEMNGSQDGIDSVPDTPVLKRNSYMENAPNVTVVVTSHDDEPSDDEPAEPPRSWIASAIRRLSQTVISEPVDKDLAELRNQGQVALEVKEIETKRRGSQSVSPDVVKIMAEWEKESKERRASFNDTESTDHQTDKPDSDDNEGYKNSYNYDQRKDSHSYSERHSSDSRRNSINEGSRYREEIRRGSISPSGSPRRSITGIADSEVKVIITSPDDESEVIGTSWIANTIRRLSNASSNDDSNTNYRSSNENINYKNNSYNSKGHHNPAEQEYEETGMDKRRSSTGSSRRGSYKNEDKRESIGKISAEGSRRGSYKNDYTKDITKEGTNASSSEYLNDAPTDWLATAVRKLSSASRGDPYIEERSPSAGSIVTDNEEEANVTQESSIYERRNSYKNDTRRKSSGSGRKNSLKGISTIASEYSNNNENNGDVKDTTTSEEIPTGWLVNAMRRLSSANIEDSHDELKINDSENVQSVEDTPTNWQANALRRSISSPAGDNLKTEDIKSFGSRRNSRGSHQTDEQPDDQNMLSPEDTPTGWLANAVRRLSSASKDDVISENRSSVERRRSSQGSYRNENERTSRSVSRTSFHSDQQDETKESSEDAPTGWLVNAVRRLSSGSNENYSNIEERRTSTGSIHSNSGIDTSQDSHISRNASRSSLNDTHQDVKNTLSPEDTPTGWLANAVRKLSSASIENEIRTEERKTSTGSAQINIDAQHDSKNILSPEDTPTGWLASAVRRLSSVSTENDNTKEEISPSTENVHNIRRRSSQGSHRSRSASKNSINFDEQNDSRHILSPEDTPTGWLTSAVRRLSSVSTENDNTKEERRPSTENVHNLGRRSSQGSHRSRSASKSSINFDEQKDSKHILSPEDTPTGWLANAVRRLSSVSTENDGTKEERRPSTENVHNLGRQSSQGSHRSRSASRSSITFDEEKDSKNILSPEDTPSGWLANAVRRLSSVSGEDINIRGTQQLSASDQASSSYRSTHQDEPIFIPNIRRSPAPPDSPPPPVPDPSSEEEEESQERVIASSIRQLSSKGSDSMSETQQLNSNPNWMNSAVRRLSMREEEPIKLPLKIQKNTSEINHQNIVKPMANEDANEDYTPVLISKKKLSKGMAWQNGFDWDFSQGPPDVTFCGCGFLGIYMVGVAEVLLEHRPELLQGRIGGSSVGSLVAACLVTGVPLQKLRKSLLHVADMAQSYTLGPLNPWFTLEEPLLQGLLEMMPQDAHIKASGRLFLSLTRLSNLSNEVVSEYPSRDELLRAILCCCWLPGISSFTAPTFMGKSYIDGAFSAVNPWNHIRNNLSVSAYAGSFTICPDDSDLFPFQPQVSALGVSYNMQPENGTRAVHALMPPQGDMLDKYYHNGVYDTHIFLTTLK